MRRVVGWLLVGCVLFGGFGLLGGCGEKAQPEQREAVMLPQVPYIYQRERYPTGCESVSAVMALRFMGYDITVDQFLDECLPQGTSPHYVNGELVGCDPYEKFPGDPRTTRGWGCFAPVIEKASAKVAGDGVTALYGVSLEVLCETYIRRGIPVIVWATGGMQEPVFHCRWQADTGRQVEWYTPMHCLLLVGFDEEYYYFHDPQVAAYTGYPKEMCRVAYERMGAQAVTIASHPQAGEGETKQDAKRGAENAP